MGFNDPLNIFKGFSLYHGPKPNHNTLSQYFHNLWGLSPCWFIKICMSGSISEWTTEVHKNSVIMNVIACKQFLGEERIECSTVWINSLYVLKKKLNKKYNHFCLTTCTFWTSCLTHTARDQVLRVLDKKHNNSEDSYAKVNADKTLCLTVNC